MHVFLDFEASSLSDDSYPIEVGWAFETGETETHLIRPAPAWTDWATSAEHIHGLARERLEREGTPHDAVARRILDTLGAHTVFVSAPSWDGKWLSVLLRAAGLPRHAMRFRDADEAHLQTALAGLPDAAPDREILAARIVDQARRCVAAGGPVAHRALADAERELAIWRETARLARQRSI